MTITKELYIRIMDIVADTLETNPEDVEGLFIDDEVLDGMSPEDSYIYTNIEKRIAVNVEGLDMGMTKLVITDRDLSFVIKIPFTGLFHMPYDYANQEYEEPVLSYRANCDILDEEEGMYNWLPDELLDIIVPNIYVGNYGCLPIYIQKKMNYAPCKIRSSERSLEYVDERGDYEEEFIDSLITRFGIQGAINRIDLMNENLEDLHNGNYGCDKYGNGYIFDYGGYNSCMWEEVS